MKNKLNALTDSATLLGIMVIGALMPTVVKTKLAIEFKSGEVGINIQSIFDQIIPSIFPVISVVIIYSMLNIKKMTSGKMVMLIMLASIILSYLNIL